MSGSIVGGVVVVRERSDSDIVTDRGFVDDEWTG
jgi:hypothetical protein